MLLGAQAGSDHYCRNHAGDHFCPRTSALQRSASIGSSLHSATLGKAERLVVTIGGALQAVVARTAGDEFGIIEHGDFYR